MPSLMFKNNQAGLTVIVAGERIQLNQEYREQPIGVGNHV